MKRSLSSCLAALIILSTPGLAPYQALAQNLGARPVGRAEFMPRLTAPAAVPGLGAPSFAPSLTSGPSLSAPSLAPRAALAASAVPTAVAPALTPAALVPVAAIAAAAPAGPTAPAVQALRALNAVPKLAENAAADRKSVV